MYQTKTFEARPAFSYWVTLSLFSSKDFWTFDVGFVITISFIFSEKCMTGEQYSDQNISRRVSAQCWCPSSVPADTRGTSQDVSELRPVFSTYHPIPTLLISCSLLLLYDKCKDGTHCRVIDSTALTEYLFCISIISPSIGLHCVHSLTNVEQIERGVLGLQLCVYNLYCASMVYIVGPNRNWYSTLIQ